MRQALDQTDCHRVAHTDEDERNLWRISVYRDSVWRRGGDDDLWAKRNELGCELGDPLGLGLRVTILDLTILAYDIAALA
jgi:hypothetical protein